MSKKWLIAGAVLLAIGAVGLVAWNVVRHRGRAATPAATVGAPVKAFEGNDVTLTGRVIARTEEQVDASVAGILDAWFVEVGQEVYEDQLVGRIRNADLENAVQQAQSLVDRGEVQVARLDAQMAAARLEVSRSDAAKSRAHSELDRLEEVYQRYRKLMDAGAIARLTFEKTESDYKAAKADVTNREAAAVEAQEKVAKSEKESEEAKRALTEQTAALAKAKEAAAECDLHSPADGVVVARSIHQGDKVEGGTKALLTVATDLTNLAVSLRPDATILARIHAGQHAFVRLGDAELPGEVKDVKGSDVIVAFSSPEPVTKLDTPAQVRIVF